MLRAARGGGGGLGRASGGYSNFHEKKGKSCGNVLMMEKHPNGEPKPQRKSQEPKRGGAKSLPLKGGFCESRF